MTFLEAMLCAVEHMKTIEMCDHVAVYNVLKYL